LSETGENAEAPIEAEIAGRGSTETPDTAEVPANAEIAERGSIETPGTAEPPANAELAGPGSIEAPEPAEAPASKRRRRKRDLARQAIKLEFPYGVPDHLLPKQICERVIARCKHEGWPTMGDKTIWRAQQPE
jgi:hypothetical protein